MGFLDKLFGINNINKPEKVTTVTENTSDSAPFGVSWGTKMPAEENQFNSGKPYDQYFYDIFTEAFPTYQINNEKIRKGKATLFTFYNGSIKELVVEVMSENSSAMSVCFNCHKEHVPYLRFYYNHEGWWNTKKYVLNRVRNSLGMAVQD